jgi:hypothetical protein
VTDIEKKRLYRGKGGEHMRNVVCRFIETVSMAELPINLTVHKRFMDTIDDCLKSPLEHVQLEAKLSFDVFSRQYHREVKASYAKYMTTMLKGAESDPNFAVKRGYTRALSCWSELYLSENVEKILDVLKVNCKIHADKNVDDAETRKFAIESIITIFCKLKSGAFGVERFRVIYDLC